MGRVCLSVCQRLEGSTQSLLQLASGHLHFVFVLCVRVRRTFCLFFVKSGLFFVCSRKTLGNDIDFVFVRPTELKKVYKKIACRAVCGLPMF